jgi:hypothetical protein
MNPILFNIASRSRPEKFHKLIAQIKNFCTEPYTILAKVDTDDPALEVYLQATDVNFQVGLSDNKIHAINRDIPKEGWDIIADVSDDFVFTSRGFDDIIREHCGPDDYLLFPEDFADREAAAGKNERIAILYCAGRDYYLRDGFVYNPIYKSLFCDNEGTRVARLRGRLKEVNEVIFFHAHPAAGYGIQDAQTRKTEAFYGEDKITFEKRVKEGFGL